ncbi:MoaD/ThiS family protein [Youngiibacter multivorans]|uniref:Molybdopterin converting factor small subunit n=1 Tax=Youngiibacter multivorans TaxID=937251 RepID=A0ABS4G0C7_9CLOT|nr:MoaD/ThiS family protein [Youngiibacter multivorans]MBP1917931.1 molybdopterin converting factor small subunit [Youngiibacter multivorans]
MENFKFSIYDGCEPRILELERTPEDFTELLSMISDRYPGRHGRLMEGIIRQQFTVIKNTMRVELMSEPISEKDKVIIMASVHGG